ncbi:hypothetical protein HDU99_003935 [Rhizoclosmatium hyalinum]|nr:hypothetical protein HDU99_003935 [Rhizoclosmatium hyalinum]
MEAILKPEIKRRRQQEKQADQFDFLDLLMEQETNDEYLTTNILLLQIAAMRNTSLMLQNILYDIAENPSIANALRREMKEHIDFSLNEPLTRQTLTNLTLLDAFVRESLFQSAKPITSVRTATSDTAINGFDIPAGTDILLYGAKVHGKAFWETPMEEFNPDRWIGSGKHATTTSSEYMLFGGGKTICPGRFLAVLEMKTFVCCLLNRYDVRLHHGGKVKREFSMKHVLPAMEKGKQVPLVFVPRK